ncbi:MAG: helix-hairpin-helix domain-containing protein, partial [Chitinophagaceae bacterium]
LAKLMDIHAENPFKIKSYASAAFTIENLTVELSSLAYEKIAAIKGIGDAIAQKIAVQMQTGSLPLLQEYLLKTPPGILEMMQIKGLGPKKITTIWKELGIESVGELLYACNENRLLHYKGFGEKSQAKIKEAINFYFASQGSYLYQQVMDFANTFTQELKKQFPNTRIILTGEYIRQDEIINQLDWVCTIEAGDLVNTLTTNNYQLHHSTDKQLIFKTEQGFSLCFNLSSEANFYRTLFELNCSEEYLTAFKKAVVWDETLVVNSEEAVFAHYKMPYLPPYLRSTAAFVGQPVPEKLIQPTHIKGIIHCHSHWSDGMHSINEMAEAAIAKGYEYLILSDHSKTAFYAQGLSVERILAQHAAIDEWNANYQQSGQFAKKPFKIFKSIESDILHDGSLDYEPDILAKFDLIIASVHANLQMTEEKAMHRLLTAINNKYTSILGHMTGRLLLSRAGYPVNHTAIIDACAKNKVVIELNAHPRRLDIDWRFIQEAVNTGVTISINPDAHSTDGFDDCVFGVLVAQKAGLAYSNNLSSYSLPEIEAFISAQHQKRL